MLAEVEPRPELEAASRAGEYVRHLSRILFSRKASAKVMAYFSAYFDESYRDGSPMMAVAGYIATDEKWIQFADRWTEVVEREKVLAFHWSDMETFNDEFTREKGWDETRRLKVQKELIQIIKETISFGLCVGVNVPEYEQHLWDVGSPGYESAYTYAVRLAVSLANHESLRNGWRERVAYLIERSIKKHKSELNRAFRHVFDDEDLREKLHLGTLTPDANRIDNVPLQAADVVAYETWKDIHNELVELRKRKRRGSFQNLIEVPHLYGYAGWESLRNIADKTYFPVRFLRVDDYEAAG